MTASDAAEPSGGSPPITGPDTQGPPKGEIVDLDFLERLVGLLEDSGLHELEIESEGTRVRLAKPPSGPWPAPATEVSQSREVQPKPALDAPADALPDAAPEPSASELVDVEAPMVGTFYRAPSPNAPPYVEAGDRIAVGDTLCIIEAMKLMNELESEVAGTIAEICLENGKPVEYGQVLYRVIPD